jgi:hypothetical protein
MTKPISAKQRAVLARGPANSVGRERLAKIEAAEKAPVKKSAPSAKHQTVHAKAVSQSANEGKARSPAVQEERDRIKAILGAYSQDPQRQHLAFETSFSVEMCQGILHARR